MRKRTSRFLAIALLLLAALANSTPGRARSLSLSDTEHLVDRIFQPVSQPGAPGCAVGIEKDGRVLLTRGYGSADLEHDVPITPATIFEAGSVSKQFTAASILLLAQRGRLSLTDDARKYIPELPDYGTPITINDLLGHTSGLRDWGEVEAMAGWPRTTRVYTMDDILDIAAAQRKLNYAPGTFYLYVNTDFDLLAIIVGRVSGESLPAFSRRYLFTPLGMTHTQWRDDFRRVVKNRAIAYEPGEHGSRQLMPFEDTYGHAALLTTVGDLLRWNEALTNGTLGPYVTREIHRRTRLNDGQPIIYARGLFIGSYDGESAIFHDGLTAGYSTWLGRFPASRLSIALLCNSKGIVSSPLAHSVADIFLPRPRPRASVKVPSDQLARHEGLYVDEVRGLPIRLTAADDGLSMSGGPALPAVSKDEFKSGYNSIRFTDNDHFIMTTGGSGPMAYVRARPWSPSRELLRTYVGTYWSPEALATYRITLDGNRLVATPVGRRDAALLLTPLIQQAFDASGDNFHFVIHFSTNASGKVAGFDMGSNGVFALPFSRRITDRATATPP
ncbi:MAG TPA: serine hydrolase domain-containing protein [Steroidobacteraceae bacterium]|nr:serine hydrolase domain-containing protein [Steroidobacteraceae bacterium]